MADGQVPETLGSYAAVLLFYAYWRTFDRAMIEAVRIGLERAVATEPDYAEAHACLSLVYSNAFRFRHPIGATEPDPAERPFRSPPAPSSSRRARAGPATPSAWRAGSELADHRRGFAGDGGLVTEAIPSITSPSEGMKSPASTITRSPGRRSSEDTLSKTARSPGRAASSR